MLGHIFQEQHALLHLRKIRRAQQTGQYAQVAAPERGVVDRLGQSRQFGIRLLALGHVPPSAFAAAVQHFFKAGLCDLVRLFGLAPVVDQQVARPGDRLVAHLGQQGQLQRGEVAQADKARALVDGLGDLLVRNVGQDARQAVAAARGQCHIGAAGGCAANGGQAGGIFSGEALEAGERIRIHLHLVPQRLQALDAAAESRLVAHCAGGGVDVDVCHGQGLGGAARCCSSQ